MSCPRLARLCHGSSKWSSSHSRKVIASRPSAALSSAAVSAASRVSRRLRASSASRAAMTRRKRSASRARSKASAGGQFVRGGRRGDRRHRRGQILDAGDRRQREAHGAVAARPRQPIETELQGEGVALQRELDRLAGQRLARAVEQRLDRQRRLILGTARPTLRVARLPLAERLAGPALPLRFAAFADICRESAANTPSPDDPRAARRASEIARIKCDYGNFTSDQPPLSRVDSTAPSRRGTALRGKLSVKMLSFSCSDLSAGGDRLSRQCMRHLPAPPSWYAGNRLQFRNDRRLGTLPIRRPAPR